MASTVVHHAWKVDLASYQDLAELSQFSQVTACYVSCLPALTDREIVEIAKTEGRYWLAWSSSIGAWIQSGGQSVTILIHESAKFEDLNDLTLGFTSSVKGTCLNLQGQVAIHANAVCLNDKAIAFVGPSGAGKSTLSTYCVQQGMNLLTDDVLVVDKCDRVLPGNPRLKLFPHTGTALQLETPTTSDYKVFVDAQTLGARAVEAPVGLQSIYLLNGGTNDTVSIEPIPSSKAIFELLNNSYAVREFSDVWPRLFDRYQTLTETIPILTLSYPHDFSQLPEVYSVLNATLLI